MKRYFSVGYVDEHGVARPYAHCTGGCQGGRQACDCTTGCGEFTSDVGHDFYRQIKAPERKPEPNWRARAAAWAIGQAAAGAAGMAALLALFGASCFRR